MYTTFDVILSTSHKSNTTDKHEPSEVVKVITDILGWTYTVVWSLSFYPQIYTNWKRKSVTGLSFNFVSLNLAGFLFYSFFTGGLYWIPALKDEYANHNPGEEVPIQANDVIFSLHALILVIIQAIQCGTLERGNQKVSEWARVVLAMCWTLFVICLSLSITHTWSWLDFMYTFSYAKVVVTVLKYIPQVHLNYKRKSTLGWSTTNVILDFTGGWACILQMFIQAADGEWPSSDHGWISNFGDITKFWLCVITLVFDSIFLTQRFVQYGDKEPYTQFTEEKSEADPAHPPCPLECSRAVPMAPGVAPSVLLCRHCKVQIEKDEDMKKMAQRFAVDQGESETEPIHMDRDTQEHMKRFYDAINNCDECKYVDTVSSQSLPSTTYNNIQEHP